MNRSVVGIHTQQEVEVVGEEGAVVVSEVVGPLEGLLVPEDEGRCAV